MEQQQQQPEEERWSLQDLLSAFLAINFCLLFSQQLNPLVPVTNPCCSPHVAKTHQVLVQSKGVNNEKVQFTSLE